MNKAKKLNVKASNLNKERLKSAYNNTVDKIKKHVADKKPEDLYSLMIALRLPLRFMEDHVICFKCGHVEKKATYAIVQKAMGISVTFTCKCGNKIRC